MKKIETVYKWKIGNILIYLALSIFVIWSIFPLFWMLTTSIRSHQAIYALPPTLFTPRPILQNYINAIDTRILRYLANSFILCLTTSFISIIFALWSAYCFARYKAKWLKPLFYLLLGCYFVPNASRVIPMFRFLVHIRGINTYYGLIISYLSFTLPLAIWILTSFISQTSPTLEESGQLDGCSRMGAYFRITVPSIFPAILSVFFLTFIMAWNDLVFTMVIAQTNATRTIQLGVLLYSTTWGIEWGPMMAVAFVATLPGIILFSWGVKYFMAGMTRGALKG